MEITASEKWGYYQLFSGIGIEGKKLLDIGGGKATVGFLFSSRLKKYVCVDPYEGTGNPEENFNLVTNLVKEKNITKY